MTMDGLNKVGVHQQQLTVFGQLHYLLLWLMPIIQVLLQENIQIIVVKRQTLHTMLFGTKHLQVLSVGKNGQTQYH